MSKTLLAVFSADWHMTSRVWLNQPLVCGDAARSLRQVVQLAVDYGVPLLAAGDLFDATSVDSESVRAVQDACQRMAAIKQQIYFVQGQHEMSKPPWLSLFPATRHLHGRTVTLGSAVMAGLDFCSPLTAEDALKGVPQNADILLTHQVWQEFMGPNRGVCCASMQQRPRLVLTGDFHETAVVKSDGSTLVSPGSIHLTRVNQPVDKFCGLLYDDLSIEWLPLVTRRVITLATADVDEAVQAVEAATLYIHEQKVRPLVRLVSAKEVTRDRQQLTQKLQECGVAVFDVFASDGLVLGLPSLLPAPSGFDFAAVVRAATTRRGGSQQDAEELLGLFAAEDLPQAVVELKQRWVKETDADHSRQSG